MKKIKVKADDDFNKIFFTIDGKWSDKNTLMYKYLFNTGGFDDCCGALELQTVAGKWLDFKKTSNPGWSDRELMTLLIKATLCKDADLSGNFTAFAMINVLASSDAAKVLNKLEIVRTRPRVNPSSGNKLICYVIEVSKFMKS